MFRRVRVGNKFVIDTHGMPGHDVGQFPNASCPFPIVARNASYELSATPQPRPFAQGLNGWLFGVSVDGVAFDPTGPFWGPGWEFEVMHRNIRVHLGLDQNNAHVQPSGEYHYHGSPTALIARRRREMAWVGRPVMLLLGWAADGFPIYAPLGHAVAGDARSPVVPLGSNYRLRVGNRPSGAPRGAYDGSFVQDFEFRPGWGHLDDCNGRWGVTPEYPAGTYYYCITEQYPFVPRSWRGAPNATFWHPLPGPRRRSSRAGPLRPLSITPTRRAPRPDTDRPPLLVIAQNLAVPRRSWHVPRSRWLTCRHPRPGPWPWDS
jgi:hypothetical protein